MSYDDSFPCILTPLEKAFRAAFETLLITFNVAMSHDLAQTAFSSLKHWNFGIRQKREFYDIELHIYSFFEVSVKLICNHIIFSFRTNSYSNAC